MKLKYLPMPSDEVRALQAGGKDAYGCAPERTVSDGDGNPCRHCLDFVPKGRACSFSPIALFPMFSPMLKPGRSFVCRPCEAWAGEGVPPILKSSKDYLLKGYTESHRIKYGTGKVVERDDLADYAADLLGRPEISFVDVRSARNNCFQLRIKRAS